MRLCAKDYMYYFFYKLYTIRTRKARNDPRVVPRGETILITVLVAKISSYARAFGIASAIHCFA